MPKELDIADVLRIYELIEFRHQTQEERHKIDAHIKLEESKK